MSGADSVVATFGAACRSVGTAVTMAAAGFYLHRRDFVGNEGKKALALISQQVTIPAFLFSKLVYCNQNFSSDPCPSVMDDLGEVWMLLLWPLYVVGCGLLVGAIASRISSTPPWQRRSIMAACAFGNSTGLPITLLTVVKSDFPGIERIDPTLFLSVYLLLYPVLQWGIGGWLLAPEEEEEGKEENHGRPGNLTGLRHVLNTPAIQGCATMEESAKMIRELSFSNTVGLTIEEQTVHGEIDEKFPLATPEGTPANDTLDNGIPTNNALADPPNDVAPLTETLIRVMSKVFQPPVIGALLGLFVSSIIRLRGIFVDLYDRDDDSPLEWLFDGIYEIGRAAVPINMIILGINLSITSQAKDSNKGLLPRKSMAAAVIGKMVVMPFIGISTALILKAYFWNIPDKISAPFYLVLMIVFITPTANNVMVMVEISGSGTKEGMARLIGWEYAVSPVLLSISVMLVVRVASIV